MLLCTIPILRAFYRKTATPPPFGALRSDTKARANAKRAPLFHSMKQQRVFLRLYGPILCSRFAHSAYPIWLRRRAGSSSISYIHPAPLRKQKRPCSKPSCPLFLLPQSAGKNYESLYKSLTELIDKAGPQPGFVIVLEALPATPKFDKEARESLLDVFRDAAEFWADRQVQFRAFFSFEQ